MIHRVLLVLGLLALAASPTPAHEFWIEAIPAVVDPGKRVAVHAFVGDGFPGESYPRNPEHIVRFEASGPDAVVPVAGRTGRDPAGFVRIAGNGVYVVAYRSTPTTLRLAAEPFNAYLADEGLEHVLRLREERGLLQEPGRERFSRCAKTLIAVGPARSGWDRPAGLTLELIPRNDPFALAPGDTLELEVLFEGEPRPDLLLHVFRRGVEGPLHRVRTDARGRARVPVDASGRWMISGVLMTESQADGADWDSTWSSLTFEVPEARRSD